MTAVKMNKPEIIAELEAKLVVAVEHDAKLLRTHKRQCADIGKARAAALRELAKTPPEVLAEMTFDDIKGHLPKGVACPLATAPPIETALANLRRDTRTALTVEVPITHNDSPNGRSRSYIPAEPYGWIMAWSPDGDLSRTVC